MRSSGPLAAGVEEALDPDALADARLAAEEHVAPARDGVLQQGLLHRA